MKKALALAALLGLMASPLLAADIAKDPDITIEGVPTQGTNSITNENILIITVTADTFTDNSLVYIDALAANGYAADLVFDPQLYGWPDLTPYKLIILVYNDCWWDAASGAFGAADVDMLEAFTGALVIVGQDFLYSTFEYAWVTARFGMVSVTEDINFGSVGTMDLLGSPGGPFEGKEDFGGICCWDGNCWFTDDVVPTTPTNDWFDSEGYAGHGGCAVSDGIFSTVAFECFTAKQWIMNMLDWVKAATPTENTSWSMMKDLYR